uniref:C2 domain-containing protein n=1 Tax=Trichuris muris TaxID=70415 RepID=A0A5S6QUN5_TRIMR
MLTVVGRFKRAVMKQNASEHCRSKPRKMETGGSAPSAGIPSTSHCLKAQPQLCKSAKKQVDIAEPSLTKSRTGDHLDGKRLQQSQAYLSLRPYQRTRQRANFRDDFGPPVSSSSSFSSSNEAYYPYPSPNKFPKTNPFFKGTIKSGQHARHGYSKLNCVRGQALADGATVCPIVEESESTTTDSALTSSQTNSGSSESQVSLTSGNQKAQMKKIIAGLKTFGIKGELYVSMILNCGMLTISIDEARHLQPPPGTPSCNAYIRLSLMPDEEKRTQYKSEVVPGSNAPVFNLNVSFEILPGDSRKRVFVSVWNRDAKTQKGGLLGCMAFSIRGLAETKQVEGWYYLLAPSYGRHKHLAVEKVNMLTYYGSIDSLQKRQLLGRPTSGPAFL